jgi:hypothetical protein
MINAEIIARPITSYLLPLPVSSMEKLERTVANSNSNGNNKPPNTTVEKTLTSMDKRMYFMTILLLMPDKAGEPDEIASI